MTGFPQLTKHTITMEISDIKKQLRSYREWGGYKQGQDNSSYDFEIRNGSQTLYYFAGNHSTDPKDSQFDRLENLFKKFKNESKGQKTAIVSEQNFDPGKVINKEQAIRDFAGEMGYSLYIAKQNNLQVFQFEPKEKQMMAELLTEFSKDDIFYYLFARWIYWWNRGGKQTDFAAKAGEVSQDLKQSLGWESFDFSLEYFKKLHLNFFKSELDHEDLDFFATITKPSYTNTVFNLVCREESQIRDAHVVSGILGLWEEGCSLFVVYGVGHAFVQKPALQKLLS